MSDLDAKGLQVARRYAVWNLGDPAWADEILDAYFNPAEIEEELDKEWES